MISRSRRHFVKTIVLGSGALAFTGCQNARPPAGQQDLHHTLLSENFEACHQVRDGHQFEVPRASRRVEVAVIGGGPSGLIAAYRLGNRDVVLLEKESIVGGNARIDSWNGIPYAAGAISTAGNSPCMKLFAELGLQPQVIRRAGTKRSYIVNGKLYTDIWRDGLEDLHAAPTRRRVMESRQQLLDLDLSARKIELDRVTLASLLEPYGADVIGWYNDLLAWFGGTCEDYSGYAGTLLARSQMGHNLSLLYPERAEPEVNYTFPGGLAIAALALARKIEESGPQRVITGAVVYRVAHDGDDVEVSYLHGGVPNTIRTSVAIVATPKFIARHIVADLPAGQKAAMARFRYVPFLVGGVCTVGRVSDTVETARVLRGPIANLRASGPGGAHEVYRCEAPLKKHMRRQVLTDDYILRLGNEMVDCFDGAFPGARERIQEVRIWRRGHNWYLPVPGMSSEFQPEAARPFRRILFANADSAGEISEFGWALVAAERAVEEAEALLRPARETTAPVGA